MEQTKNGNHKHAAEKSQTWQRQLDDLRTLLRQRETELAACQKSMARSTEDIQKLQQDMAEREKQLSATNDETEALRKQVLDFEQNAELMRKQETHLREENADLKRAIDAEREKAARLVEEAQAEQRKAEHACHELERRLRESEEPIMSVAAGVSPSVRSPGTDHEPIAAPSATFRIDLYPRQGHYVGKIEHTLSQDKKPLKELDQETIMNFITSHLPQAVEKEYTERAAQALSAPEARISKIRDMDREKITARQMSIKALARKHALRKIAARQRKRLIRRKPPVARHGAPFLIGF